MGLKDIFKLSSKGSAISNENAPNSNEKQVEQTYQDWGVQWAGQTKATISALQTALQVVILQQKKDQSQDKQKQEDIKNKQQRDVTKLEATKKQHEQTLLDKKNSITDLESKKEDKSDELEKSKESNPKSNIATVNFWIGLSITIILAIYLFLFYSSASYQAFYGNEDSIETGNAIFYPHAYSDAFKLGFGPFLFILLMPVIFCGLGFLIHQFTISSNGIWKYFKIFILYVVTFIFDALLAYEISEKMYNFWAINQPFECPPYSLDMAITSAAFGIIIFAGFIAYVIWGLVFDFTIDCYEEKNSNSKTIKRLQNEINNISNKIEQKKLDISDIKSKIISIDGEIKALQHQIDSTFSYDSNEIKKEINNFFNGWIAYMSLAGKTNDEKAEATKVKDEIIENLN